MPVCAADAGQGHLPGIHLRDHVGNTPCITVRYRPVLHESTWGDWIAQQPAGRVDRYTQARASLATVPPLSTSTHVAERHVWQGISDASIPEFRLSLGCHGHGLSCAGIRRETPAFFQRAGAKAHCVMAVCYSAESGPGQATWLSVPRQAVLGHPPWTWFPVQ